MAFVMWAFPFSLPAPVGGPDFPHKPRPRRPDQAPTLHPFAHLQHLAGRVESSIRNSWDLVPALRRITFKWHSVWNGSLWRKWQKHQKNFASVPATEWVKAAKGLYQKLQSGVYLSPRGVPKPIQYDTRKLRYAKGLTATEDQLLQDVRSIQTQIPGTIETRRRIGRFLFGARVEMGEPLFVTISPTTRHNCLCIKFSRYRKADPGSGPCHGAAEPPLWETAAVNIDIPSYTTRKQLAARDPWAVVLSFQTVVRCIFAKLLDIRMCFECPNCQCRDTFGNNCHVTGGVLGLVTAICGAIEYQANSTPHFHCNIYIASIWQKPLKHLATELQNQSITFKDIEQFLTHIHSEAHPDWNSHAKNEATLEAGWAANYPNPEQNLLCAWPRFVAADTSPSPWLERANAKPDLADAAHYLQSYRAAVQTKVSHQQIHWHPWNIAQKCRLPIAGCRKKGAPHKCKHNFPKVPNPTTRILCRGNARKYGYSTAGKRSALGMMLGPRQDPWLSGTTHAFTLFLFGNSHTGVNFRVPLCEHTHDPACARNCLAHTNIKRLQRAMAQAARRLTRYFTGYLQKPQPLGRKELQQAAKQLTFLDTVPPKEEAAKHYRSVVHRVYGDLEFRCSVRPITEEFMLAAFSNKTEPAAAECIRTFPVAPFVGSEWLNQLDGQGEIRQKVETAKPYTTTVKLCEAYGWRGTDLRVKFLSPWEFVKWWTVKKLQPPHANGIGPTGHGLSEWKATTKTKPADGWKYGRDFDWKKNFLQSAKPALSVSVGPFPTPH